jgi:hypothetical protein
MKNLSIVITGRNDSYDGNFLERMSLALANNFTRLPLAEFIVVEWNPVKDRPLLCEELRTIFGDRIRYIIVDPKYHSEYCTIIGCDLLEFPAKNCGIRRASKDFILCTNSDVVFSPVLVNNLINLQRNKVYRASRVDIDKTCLDIRFPIPEEKIIKCYDKLTDAAGDFTLLHRDLWHKIKGYSEMFPSQRIHKDAWLIHVLVERLNHEWVNLGEATHWSHPSSWSNSWKHRGYVGNRLWKYWLEDWTKNREDWGLKNAKEEMIDGMLWLK